MCWLLMTSYLFNVLKRVRWVLYISTQSLMLYGPQFLAFGLNTEIYIVKTPNMHRDQSLLNAKAGPMANKM